MQPLLIAIISGLAGGTGGVILTYLLNRKKTQAEIAKTQAETEKIRAELNNLKTTVSNLSNPNEDIIFDGTGKVDGFDFLGKGSPDWNAEGSPITETGIGELTFETGGILNLQRKNNEGHFEIRLKRYLYKGKEESVIPRDDLISGLRKLYISCEAKVVGGEHVLEFVLRNPEIKVGPRLDKQRVNVTSNQWSKFQVQLAANPIQPCVLRVDDRELSHAPSSVQIKNFTLSQQK